jgi:N-carbamoylputrescine amidase
MGDRAARACRRERLFRRRRESHGVRAGSAGKGGIEFWGQSFIAGADGRILVRAPVDREVVLVEEIDLAEIDNVRAGWPFFRDRRIDAYEQITKRFGND